MSQHRRVMPSTLALLLLLALIAFPATPTRAAGLFTVSSTLDAAVGVAANCAPASVAPCLLRDAIAAANATSGATIAFAAGLSPTIILGSPLTLSSAMTIQGNGTLRTSITAGSASNNVFDVSASGPVAFMDLAIASGNNGINITGTGGVTVTACSLFFNASAGLLNAAASTVAVTGSSVSGNGHGLFNGQGGTVHVAGSSISQNSNTNTVVGGGGILNFGTLTVANSTLTQNSSGGGGGGIYNYTGTATVTNSILVGNSATGSSSNGGGIANIGAIATVTNSTFSGNSATGSGGGIYNQYLLTVTNSTIAGNAASPSLGGGIGNPGTVNATNTLIVDNMGSGDIDLPFATNSHNITGTFTFADPDPKKPQDHGGPTPTLALPDGSPAIGAGDPAACAASPVGGVDQRGQPRLATVCDIGAYETPGKALTAAALFGPGPNGNVPLTVIATGGSGGVMVGYRGTVTVSSTDPASVPVAYQFTATDAGRHTFPSLFATAGGWSVTATDGALTGTGAVQVPLIVAGVSPSSGDVRGGGTATIAGANFGTNPSVVGVTFGNAAATVVQVTSTGVTVRVPPNATGTVNVAVTVNGVGATRNGAYTYGITNALPGQRPAAPSGGNPAALPGARAAAGPGAGSPAPLPPARP